MSSAYWSQWDYAEVMDWVAELDEQESDADFEDETFNEDEYSMPLSLDSLCMSWADFM